MNLVFSFDEAYTGPFKVLLHSIHKNNPNEKVAIYFLYFELEDRGLQDLEDTIQSYGYSFHPINCKSYLEQSNEFHINRYYTVEMYLWLFAPYFLPEDVDRALYLDPDIINLNPISSLYESSFDDNLFIAMDYEEKNKLIQPINNLRLRTRRAKRYYNTGVVMMNTAKIRNKRSAEEIVEAVIKNKAILILPDQDIFNHLYHGEIKDGSWELYNLDPRLYQVGKVVMPESFNEKWLKDNVVFIHYLGKHKPWMEREKYRLDLGKYYFEYENQVKNLSLEK